MAIESFLSNHYKEYDISVIMYALSKSLTDKLTIEYHFRVPLAKFGSHENECLLCSKMY